jgi:hypothetical protein
MPGLRVVVVPLVPTSFRRGFQRRSVNRCSLLSEHRAKLDFIYELGNCPKLDLPSDLYWTYPPEDA